MVKILKSNIDFLKSLGISSKSYFQNYVHFRRIVLFKKKKIMEFVRRVDEIGCGRNSRSYIYRIQAMSWMKVETWEQKMKTFRCLGLSDNDNV